MKNEEAQIYVFLVEYYKFCDKMASLFLVMTLYFPIVSSNRF